MSSSTAPASQVTENIHDLPEDIFTYNDEKFHNFIKQRYGSDLAELLKFQAITNGTLLVNTSCDEILVVLKHNSNDINKLKELCCFCVADGKSYVKLGVKLAINSLIQLLKMKQEKQQKKKRTSIKHLPVSIETLLSTDQTQTGIEVVSPSVSIIQDTLSTQSNVRQTVKRLNEIEHKIDIEDRIDLWWRKTNGNDGSSLQLGVHYFLAINKSVNDRYAGILSCRCKNQFKLSFTTSGIFSLSTFYRHFKEKHRTKDFKRNQVNDSSDDETSSVDTTDVPIRSSNSSSTRPKTNQTSTHASSKRLRSPSRRPSSTLNILNAKKNRL
ncbi:unnamed protein product [Adineta ricciae]|uniref:Uncharacterized protein n=1 Tax=Adineta ricciae TaxID=249248 RepID=A0A816E4B1_ADIRI|nr:unnamed protein product [Adineta ricciae]CAF1647508.1 unnamed protein product [Adineta ricciae]